MVPYGSPEPGTIKVTVRMPIAHALLLSRRARAADVSQGSYLADSSMARRFALRLTGARRWRRWCVRPTSWQSSAPT